MPSSDTTFNAWRDFDPANDRDQKAPEHRLSHLTRYMCERIDAAKYLLVAEAPGFCGAKFSGCAMTSERALIEAAQSMFDKDIHFGGEKFRTSKVTLASGDSIPRGSVERTATVVWDTMLKLCGSHDFVLWNGFAWHPHPKGDMLDNRAPTAKELEQGAEALGAFLEAFPGRDVIAVGGKAVSALTALGVRHAAVRHPSYGGVPEFRSGMGRIILGGGRS